jgi:VWFA-related protein
MDYLLGSGKNDKKVLIVISDGDDNSSTTTRERLNDRVGRSEVQVQVYTIGLTGIDQEQSSLEAKRARATLEQLAGISGGQSFYPHTLPEIQNATRVIARDLRQQYTVTYSPANQNMDGKFREVRVGIDGGYTVRARRGYFAFPSSRP